MDTAKLTLVIKSIVAEQKQIIGPMAISEANKVPGVKITADLQSISISGDSASVLTALARQYEKLFGQASIEACRESIKELLPQIPSQDIPTFLR